MLTPKAIKKKIETQMKETEKIDKPGYYWVQDLSWDGKLVHRIIQVVEVQGDNFESTRGSRGGWSYSAGLYVERGERKPLSSLGEYFHNRDMLKIEPVPLPENFNKE